MHDPDRASFERLRRRPKALQHFERYQAPGGADPRVSNWIDELR